MDKIIPPPSFSWRRSYFGATFYIIPPPSFSWRRSYFGATFYIEVPAAMPERSSKAVRSCVCTIGRLYDRALARMISDHTIHSFVNVVNIARIRSIVRLLGGSFLPPQTRERTLHTTNVVPYTTIAHLRYGIQATAKLVL